jgi:hypothetical protein
MANSGTALAATPARIIVGPVSTQAGFQYWYLACFPDYLIAVRQSMAAFFALAMSHSGRDSVSPITFLVQRSSQPSAQAMRQRIETALQSTPKERLLGKPNVVYRATQLKAIVHKSKKGAPLFLSDLMLETTLGSRQRYGIASVDFEKIYSQLKEMYPAKVSSI